MYDTLNACTTEVLNRLGALSTQADYVAQAVSYVNAVHKETLSLKPWPFLSKRGGITCTPPETTGSVSWTQGSPLLTGVGTAFTTVLPSPPIGYFFKLGSSQNLYRIDTVTDATNIIVAPSIAEATASGVSYQLFRMMYAAPIDFRMPQEPNTVFERPPMRFLGNREFHRRYAESVQFGVPEVWTLIYDRISGIPEPLIGFYPPTNAYLVVQFDYTPLVTDLAGVNDPILIPDEYRELLIEGAQARFYKDVFDNPPKAEQAMGLHNKILSEMKSDYGFFDDQAQVVPFLYRKKKDSTDDRVIERMAWTGVGKVTMGGWGFEGYGGQGYGA